MTGWSSLAQAVDPTGAFLQYGAMGLLALMSIIAVRVLFARETRSLDLERARAERLEGELRKLNETIQDRILTALAEANLTMVRALEAIRREDRGG